MSLLPCNHESMAPRTYPSTTGKSQRRILVLEEPAVTRNGPEVVFEVLKIQCIPEPLETAVPGLCQVNDQGLPEEEISKYNMKEWSRWKLHSMKQIWDGVSKEKKITCHRKKDTGMKFSSAMQSNLELAEQTQLIKTTMEHKQSRFLFYHILNLKNYNIEKAKTKWNKILPWFPLLLLSMCFRLSFSQGHFPQMENIAAFKPVSTSPLHSTCGFPERSSYCQSAASQTELEACYEAFCVQDCPYRSSTPPYAPLLLPSHRGSCVTEDFKNTPITELEDGSSGSSSVIFSPVKDGCLVSLPSQKLGALGSFTLAVWVKPNTTGEMMLLEMSSEESLAFAVTISAQAVVLQYSRSNSQVPLMVIFRTSGRLAPFKWTHLTLQNTNHNTCICTAHQNTHQSCVSLSKHQDGQREYMFPSAQSASHTAHT